MPKKESSSTKKTALIIGGIILALLIVGGLFMAPNAEKIPTTDKKEAKTPTMSIDEAQTKCMLMEEADLVNTMGEAFGDDTTEKAKNTCLAQWDLSKNPNNTQDKFIEAIASDWEERKDEVLEGYTLQQLYDESK